MADPVETVPAEEVPVEPTVVPEAVPVPTPPPVAPPTFVAEAAAVERTLYRATRRCVLWLGHQLISFEKGDPIDPAHGQALRDQGAPVEPVN